MRCFRGNCREFFSRENNGVARGARLLDQIAAIFAKPRTVATSHALRKKIRFAAAQDDVWSIDEEFRADTCVVRALWRTREKHGGSWLRDVT